MRDISLIVATVGRTIELNRLFDSLLAQSFRNFEVIVVDQNDDERLKYVLQRARSLGIVLRHIRHHPPNLALARNIGITAAKGMWLGFPDDDCWYEPQTLHLLIKRSQQADIPHGVIGRWVEQDPELAPGLLCWEKSSRFRDLPVSSITLFIHKSLISRLGGFDSRLGVGQWFGAAEETDMVLRALKAHANFVYEPDIRIHHKPAVKISHLTQTARKLLLNRARGTGALYAKHQLSMWVIARGVLAPLLIPLLKGQLGTEFMQGLALAQGRLHGWLRWLIQDQNKTQHHSLANYDNGLP